MVSGRGAQALCGEAKSLQPGRRARLRPLGVGGQCLAGARDRGNGPLCMHRNRSGLDDATRRWLSRLLDESSLQVCTLQETHFSPAGLEGAVLTMWGTDADSHHLL
ncbi:hypothetical protein CGC20_5980 [Leishmania donovani]|uniref:Uncharacterized protein n=1 Tax=Leishmania donovani TaxID=5661 RepID=A0A504X2R2_LEIDO|nr:hypothetical protein CGC20_5980 [Leishmania donovani]